MGKNTTPAKLSWDKCDANEYSAEFAEDTWVEISRQRPSRYRADAGRGLVEDREAKFMWSGYFIGGPRNGEFFDIPDGANVRAAKKIAERAAADTSK